MLVALALAACATDTEAESDEGTGSDEIVAKVLANAATVYPDRLEFPKSAFNYDLRRRVDTYREAIGNGKTKADVENVILVGDRESGATTSDGEIKEDSKNPYGYIRRAIAWKDEGDKTIVTTEVASLDEAFAEFSSNGMVTIGGTPGAKPQSLGVSRQALEKKIPFTLPLVDLAGKELYRLGPAAARIKTGSVKLDATIDFAADISWFKLKSARLVMDGTLDSAVVLEVATDGPIDQTFEKEVLHKKYKLAGVGPVSLSVDVIANVSCDIVTDSAFGVTGGLDADLVNFQGGVTYDRDDGLKPAFRAPTFVPKVIAPEYKVNGKANVACTLKPVLQVLLFDQPGPAITPTVTTRIEASNPPLQVKVAGAADAKIRGKLSIFGKDLGTFDRDLFSIQRDPLWQYPSQ